MGSLLSHCQLKEASAVLEELTKHQAAVQSRLIAEKLELKEQIDARVQSIQREQSTQAELQTALVQLNSANAQLSQQLAEEQEHKKDLHKSSAELQARLKAVQDEHSALLQQLQLERDVHQQELKSVNRTLKLCQQERDDVQAQIHKLKVTSFRNVTLFFPIDTRRGQEQQVARPKAEKFFGPYFLTPSTVSNVEGHRVCFAAKSQDTTCLFLRFHCSFQIQREMA